MTTTTVLTTLVGILAIISLAVYIFGIPPELKRSMEKKALKAMGENKASYIMKGILITLPLTQTKAVSLPYSTLELKLTLSQTKSTRSPHLTIGISMRLNRILALDLVRR